MLNNCIFGSNFAESPLNSLFFNPLNVSYPTGSFMAILNAVDASEQ